MQGGTPIHVDGDTWRVRVGANRYGDLGETLVMAERHDPELLRPYFLEDVNAKLERPDAPVEPPIDEEDLYVSLERPDRAVVCEIDGETVSWLPDFVARVRLEVDGHRLRVRYVGEIKTGDGSLEHRERLDSEARSLCQRPSSVFSVPCRKAAEIAHKDGGGYDLAAETNEDVIGKGLTKQSYGIAAAIGEVDRFLRGRQDLVGGPIHESHPEVCLAAMEDGVIEHSKKTAQGIAERLARIDTAGQEVLGDGFSSADALTTLGRQLSNDPTVEIDDVVDAMALAIVAARGDHDRLAGCSERCEHGEGFPMEMIY